ncbi:MAG: hypothetical protein WEF50_16530 [Myxococcota bacterium]
MRTPGRGFFSGGAVAFIVVGLMHLTAQLQPPPPGAEAAHDAMVAFTVTALGRTWSISDAYDVLSVSFAALSILVGVLDLYVLRALQPAGASLRGLARVNGLGALALATIAGLRSVAPPLYLYAVVTLLFMVSARRSRAPA